MFVLGHPTSSDPNFCPSYILFILERRRDREARYFLNDTNMCLISILSIIKPLPDDADSNTEHCTLTVAVTKYLEM